MGETSTSSLTASAYERGANPAEIECGPGHNSCWADHGPEALGLLAVTNVSRSYSLESKMGRQPLASGGFTRSLHRLREQHVSVVLSLYIPWGGTIPGPLASLLSEKLPHPSPLGCVCLL